MDVENKSKMEFWKDVNRIKQNVLVLNKEKPKRNKHQKRKTTTASMEYCGMVVTNQEKSKTMQSTIERKETMKRKIENYAKHD